ncbi:MAG: hypothetical protein U9Q78_08300 [Chloroflexota bacterium]|nr:hypothetical protein [Chloroflexota bacterium]
MDEDIEQLIRYLAAHTECPVCGHRYDPDDFEVLHEGENLLVLLITCHHCQTEGLLMASVQEQRSEPRRVEEAKPITADDVLDIHCFLERFEGDLETLVGNVSQAETSERRG